MASGLPYEDLEYLKKGKSYLFGIGIGAYQKITPKLPNARKDVEDIAELLAQSYYFERNPDLLLFDDKATKRNIINALYRLNAKLEEDDRLLIYYSGHGDLHGEHGFWIPVDAEDGDFASFVSNAEVRDIVKHIKVRHILLISDSCFSAALLMRDPSRKVEGAFTAWIQKTSRYVFTSGAGPVSDGKAGQNSPFAAHLMERLRQNEAETLNIVSLANDVIIAVRSNHDQQGELCVLQGAGDQGGQFVFLKKQTERDDWEAACRTNTEKAYLNFLDKYPDGQFEEAADQKLAEIAELDAWQAAKHLDSAHSYRQYLKKYKKGARAKEAEAKLALIRKAEDVKNVEVEKKEQERLAKIEAEKELERQALLETQRKERVHAARIAAEKQERERQAQIEAENERERQLKIEADRKLARVATEKQERERQAKIKAEKARFRILEPEMIFVKGGSFKMGSKDYDEEKPIHPVILNDFYIGKYSVTQKEWRAVMGADPPELSFKGCDQCPVENVSWDDIHEFLQKLNRQTGKKYHLPTEAEWEYAARGGAQSKRFTYSGSNNLDDVAWYVENSDLKTHPAGGKQANELGIYDMCGNVWEWCNDWFDENYYKNSPSQNPKGPESGSDRVIRGGSWYNGSRRCRSSDRDGNPPDDRDSSIGLRVAVSLQ